jgi:phosphatidylglycerophosphatase A
MKRPRSITLMAATGGYVGYLPVVPGTFGTLAGLFPVYLLSLLGDGTALMAVALTIALAVWTAGRAEKEINASDPGCIVIDEIAGIMVTLWSLPFEWLPVIAGFLIFRCLDMIKPFPIRQIERKLSGGVGIVADDIVAGVIAHVLLRMVLAVVQ